MTRTYTFKNINAGVLGWHLDLGKGDAAEDYGEWFWLDGQLESGYQFSLGLFTNFPPSYRPTAWYKARWGDRPEMRLWPAVDFHVATPDGKVHRGIELFPPESFKPAPWGVSIGHNTYTGKLNPRTGMPESYHLKVAVEDMTIDLKASVVATGVVFSDEEHGYSYYHPVKKRALGWWPLIPRAEIEGTITVGGKTIRDKGLLFCERQLTNLPVSGPSGQLWWFWGHFFAGDYTAVWTDSAASEHFNYRHFSPFVLWKGSDVVLSTYNFAAYVEKFDLDSDGIPYPSVVSLKASDGVREMTAQIVKGTITNRLESYVRQRSEVRLQLKHWGETQEVRGEAIHEWGCGPDWFPKSFDKAFKQ